MKRIRDFEEIIYNKKFNMDDIMIGMDLHKAILFEDSDKYYHSGEFRFDFDDLICMIECELNWFEDGLFLCNGLKVYTVNEDGIENDILEIKELTKSIESNIF